MNILNFNLDLNELIFGFQIGKLKNQRSLIGLVFTKNGVMINLLYFNLVIF